MRTMGGLLVAIDWNNGDGRRQNPILIGWIIIAQTEETLTITWIKQTDNGQWALGLLGSISDKGTKERRQENNGNMSRGSVEIGRTVPNRDFVRRRSRAHSEESLPLRIPTGDLVKLTLLYTPRWEKSAALCASGGGHLQLIRGQHF